MRGARPRPPSRSAEPHLFEQLGYEIDPVRVDADTWRDAGFDVSISSDDLLEHCGRVGEVELLSLCTNDPDAPRRVLESYRSFNRLLRPLLVVERSDGTSIWGWGERAHIGRLDVPADRRSGETRRRLELMSRRSDGDLAIRIETALSRESVSERFFRGFSDAVESIERSLVGQRFGSREARSWAILFLSRILFLSFIQEKEWLDGDRQFLVSRVSQVESNGSAFHSFLQPLFFDCLNVRSSRRNRRAKCLGRIPYLNGGLFRRTSLEESKEPAIPDELVGTIIVDVFARYPFTFREDDESVVAVDPEMLGHVFESLMEQGDRVRSGSFYTPKRIVDHLVKRAITRWIGENDEALAADRVAHERLRSITVLDPACGSGAFLLAAMKEIERLRRSLGDDTPAGRLRQEIVEHSLFGVDLKPEAVQLCELRLWLAIVAARPDGVEAIDQIEPLPNLDRNVRQGNSLLDPFSLDPAHRRTLCRSWKDENERRKKWIDSYRHARGRRRAALSAKLRSSDLERGSILLEHALDLEREDLRDLESQGVLFGTATGSSTISRVRRRIGELEDELAKIREGQIDFFSFELHFSQVMDDGGFDLVLGNPPWVRGANLTAAQRTALRERYEWLRPMRGRSSGPFPQFELSVLFLEKATRVASSDGVISMLVPGKLMKAYYAERCRWELETNQSLLAIDDWSRESDLFDADTFPIGLTFTSGRSSLVGRLDRSAPATAGRGEQASGRNVELTQSGASWRTSLRHLHLSNGSTAWSILPESVRRPLQDVWASHESLQEVLGRSPVMGVKTGANEIFLPKQLKVGDRGGLTREGVHLPWKALTRCVRGRDVRRWKSLDSTWMVWPEESGRETWKRRYAEELDLEPDRLRLAYVRPEHLGWKVAWKDLATRLEAVVLPDAVEILGRRVPLVPNQTLYCLDAASIDETYLIAAILNSTLLTVLARAIAEPAKDGYCRFFGRTIAELPWPRLDPGSQEVRRLVKLSRSAHAGEDVQLELDRIVARLYGLDDDDLTLLAAPNELPRP